MTMQHYTKPLASKRRQRIRIKALIYGYHVVFLSLGITTFFLSMINLSVKNAKYIESKSSYNEKSNITGSFVVGVIDCMETAIGIVVVHSYDLYYTLMAALLFLFSVLFIIGVHKENHHLVTLFFAYCFCHVFLSLWVLVLEAQDEQWMQFAVIVCYDLVLMSTLVYTYFIRADILKQRIKKRQGVTLRPPNEESSKV